MTIVFDVSYIQKGAAGIGRYSLELLRRLVALDARNDYILHGWSYSLDRNVLESVVRDDVSLSISRIPGSLKRLYWNHLRTPSLASIVGPFDVFHGSEPLLPPLGGRSAIVTVHDLAYLKYPQFFHKSILRRDPHVRRSVKEAAAIIVPSLATKNDLMDLLHVEESRIHLVRPPVLPECSPVRDATRDDPVLRRYGLNVPFCLFVGVIEPRKNIEGIIRAFEQLVARGVHDLDLVMVGRKGWLFHPIVEAIERSSARRRIHRLDFVSDQDLVSLYRSARFFVYPSFFEGYGSPVVEAMASGVPVITSRNSSLQEITGDAALLVDPHDRDGLIAAVEELASDDGACLRLAARGLVRVGSLQSENAAEIVLGIYDEVGRR